MILTRKNPKMVTCQNTANLILYNSNSLNNDCREAIELATDLSTVLRISESKICLQISSQLKEVH